MRLSGCRIGGSVRAVALRAAQRIVSDRTGSSAWWVMRHGIHGRVARISSLVLLIRREHLSMISMSSYPRATSAMEKMSRSVPRKSLPPGCPARSTASRSRKGHRSGPEGEGGRNDRTGGGGARPGGSALRAPASAHRSTPTGRRRRGPAGDPDAAPGPAMSGALAGGLDGPPDGRRSRDDVAIGIRSSAYPEPAGASLRRRSAMRAARCGCAAVQRGAA